jgi:hypothetical protein
LTYPLYKPYDEYKCELGVSMVQCKQKVVTIWHFSLQHLFNEGNVQLNVNNILNCHNCEIGAHINNSIVEWNTF